ncbi:MAG: hypothetical protein ABWY27_11785, partial [Telluria sp.]
DGSNNTQLQTSSKGNDIIVQVFDWKAENNGKLRTATVRLLIRGLQGATQTQKGFAALVDAAGNYAGAPFSLTTDSDVQGGFTQLSIRFDLPAALPAGPIRFALKTGNRGTDADDLEFTGVSIQLE